MYRRVNLHDPASQFRIQAELIIYANTISAKQKNRKKDDLEMVTQGVPTVTYNKLLT